MIDELKALISREEREEEYQQFLARNPVFLDPLAAKVIPKHSLGNEIVTDFVIRRFDGRYLVVEIKRPQDRLFTESGDFTAVFTHAYGQVLEYQEWLESNIAYARTQLPEISSPRGLMIMGRRNQLNDHQKSKLRRFCINSGAINVLTYDDLVESGSSLYQSIYRSISDRFE